nr:BatA domain-containing protein [Verrucomicrobiota bacterium]
MALLNPAFLLAIAAVGVPLWLHLSRRRKYREMEVGTLRFLHQALRERRKKLRIEELPLLLLRMAAIALLAFVFARPFWPRAEKVPEKEAETLILLDASGSITADMAEDARNAARRAVSNAGATKVQLAQFSDEVQPLDSLEAYRPIAGAPTKIDSALGWALDHFLLAGGSSGKIVLISHVAADALPAQPPRVWPPQVAVELVALQPPSVDNAAVRRVSLLTPYVGEEMELEALVWLPPVRTSEEERTITLEAEGVRETAVVPPGAERDVFRFHPPHAHVRGWVSVAGGDAWPADDRRPFAVHWTEPARVLLVDGQPGSTPFEGQAYFIEKALAASGAAHGKSPFKPEIVFALAGRSGPLELTDVRAIALCGVTELAQASARALAEFVAGGGGLISVLNEQWTPGATAALVEAGLFPEAVALTGGEEKRALASWD